MNRLKRLRVTVLAIAIFADLVRSGMCKAGFAGDDAPRAVFRESSSAFPLKCPEYMIDKGQPRSLVDPAIMGKIPNSPSPAWRAIVGLFRILT